jgi:predicted aldo/keto reductase-like oxidoreductase
MRNKTVGIIPLKKGGGNTITLKIPSAMTLVRCIAYTLSQVGVSTTILGVSSLEELDEILSYQDATAAEKDYSEIVKGFKECEAGQCVYCNHCLPCPSGIDIGLVTRLLDVVRLTEDVKATYNELETKASECTKCGVCMGRCPFNINIISNMERAANLFG